MQLNTIEEIIEDFRLGKPVVLMDDEDRENEGDLIVAAEKITPEIVNFMTKEARGLMCLTLTNERCDFLGLEDMVRGGHNQSAYKTPFTVSIEAAEGVTTGISAHDRARTIQVAVDPLTRPEQIVQPGHVFPLRAQDGGVLSRAGHTEAGCDLARLAGLTPAATLIEIMNEDGSMSRRADLEKFAKQHQLKIGTIADLINYRIMNEQTVEQIEQGRIDTDFGQFEMHVFKDTIVNSTHIALTKGRVDIDHPIYVRVHTVEPFRDLLAAHPIDQTYNWSLSKSMAKVAEAKEGVVVLLDNDLKLDLGLAWRRFKKPTPLGSAYRTIGTGSQILRDLGVSKMRLLNMPIKFGALSGFGLEIVEYVACDS